MNTSQGEILELGHHEFEQRVENFDIDLLGVTGPLVRLCIAVQAHPSKPPGPGKHRGATTLAIRMDQAAAIELLTKLRVLARKMDWPLPREGENQA